MARANPKEINPAALGISLLALLEKGSRRAGTGVVHRLRTTVRRLEVHLGTLPPATAKSLKKLRKKAGKVRDIDVHLGLLEPPLLPARGRKAADSPEARYQEKLQRILQKQRKRRSDALRTLVRESTPLLEARLPDLVEQHSARKITVQESRQKASRARRRFVQWTRNIPEDPERLHQLRIRAKKERYLLEPLQDCEEAIELAEKFKQVQDVIGQWHDWVTLAEIAEQCLDSKNSKNSEAAPLLDALHARVEREYRRARRSAASVRSWILGSKPGKASAAGGRGKSSPQPAAGAGNHASASLSVTHGKSSLPARKGPVSAGASPKLTRAKAG